MRAPAHNLPPRVGRIEDGEVIWERLGEIDFGLLGYFLSCHLIIEHYLHHTLTVLSPKLNWDASKQTFSQKLSLLSAFKFDDQYDALPAIKHMNSLRNKLSHRIDFKLTETDLIPFIHLLKKGRDATRPLSEDPKEILEEFTVRACAFFAGLIVGVAKHKQLSKA